ncbi:adenine deaminase [Thermodesulfatator indicus DSM 15286]|uniref:Adenine deaminase n=1 Tax=Thermodesulfatator indicus (strain DSM 15286 / JCM 11887 / CIR29812) TaxID=667014 RepID=F8ACA9_THEID|nr:adenine deaminase [Thermodesulfatator indicus DSM 15286]
MQEDFIFFKNAKIINVYTKEVLAGSFGLKKDRFLFVDYSADQNILSQFLKEHKEAQVIDLEGCFVCPPFIDGHLHIESSHLIPSEFEKFALRSGVGKVVIDPHEIANVCGKDGIKFMLSDARLLEVYVMIPSCVPASPFETSGREIGPEDVEELLSFHERVLGLAEVMNYPGVINEDTSILAKIKAAQKLKKIIDGHAPLLKGKGLNQYIFHGVMSDHECVEGDEALEKLRLGMWLMVREGTASKNIYLLEKLKKLNDFRRIMLVSDDISPLDLEEYMLKVLRKATKYVDPLAAIQMVTINPASYFNLPTGIKPGNQADFLVFKDIETFKIKDIWFKGKPLSFWEKNLLNKKTFLNKKLISSIKTKPKTLEEFLISGFDDGNTGKVRLIKPFKDSLLTGEVILPINDAKKELKSGNINRIYVIERYKNTGRIGKGLILGLIKKGAIASSYAHDSHNIVVIGKDLEDIVIAVNELIKMQGGFVLVKDGKIIAKVPLKIGGIMADDAENLIKNLQSFYEIAKEISLLKDILLSMSFFSLSVIPELKITDFGLVKNFKLVSLVEHN